MKYLLLMLMVVCHPLWAKDILWMSNGDRLTGTIEEIGDESVRISLPLSPAVESFISAPDVMQDEVTAALESKNGLPRPISS
ncbi:hypothetical protein [Aeromonas veronii]|uniref:hypothetical protein n=1 Tax=Aeromonas veronii TaxID=654 RepID=UPI000E0901F5|nr:hypothetical protein [Aeromonas veronii]RDE62469.1 hypothetical protein DV708_12220 [Aeromonas veronii]